MNPTMMKRTALMTALLLSLALAFALPAWANTAQLSGTVFLDQDGNSQYSADEKAIADAEISLINISGQSESLVSQVKTGQDGQYHFTGLPAGEYYLQVSLPSGHYFTEPAEGGSVALPGSGQKSKSPAFTIEDGERAQKVIGAIKSSAYINLIAFGDLNMNGGRMSSEPLLRNVEVQLIYEHKGQAYVITDGKTGKKGDLQFRDLTPATYRIAVSMPEPYIIGPLGQKINPFYNVIPPTENNRGISEPFKLDRSLGMGIGGVKAGTLRGSIWNDSNMDGVRDANEGGYPGILITLTHLEMNVTRTITTTQDAEFSFEYLQAGEYSIQADLPEGIMFALPGSPSLFTDGFTANQSMKLNVREDGATQLEPIGVMPASSVMVSAVHDSNVNGLMDEGEPAFSGAKVEAIVDNQVKTSAMTDAAGRALLPRVRHGEVHIQVTLPDGQIFSVSGAPEGNAFYSTTAASALSVTLPLSVGEQASLFAGVTLPSSITGVLFDDSNLSGVRDGNETGIAGFKIVAVNDANELVTETTTDAEGTYTLDNLVPASYRVRFMLASPYVFSALSETGQGTENKVAEQVVEYGQTNPISLSPGMAATQIDAGAFRSAVINGSILLGDEYLGFDGQLGGLSGVRVDLLNEDGTPVSEYTNAISDEQGHFSLKGALPGEYILSFTLPPHAKFSQPLVDDTQIKSSLITVKASDELGLKPLFAVKTGIVSGLAFIDQNNDGLKGEQEASLSGVQLQLTDQSTQEVYTASSDAEGQYLVEKLRPGTYDVTVTLPEGFGIDKSDASLVPASIYGTSAAELVIDMGSRIENGLLPAVIPVSLQATAFYDNNLNDTFDAGTDTPYAIQASLTHQKTGIITNLSTDESGLFTGGMMFPGQYDLVLSLPELHLLTAPKDAEHQQNTWEKEIVLDENNSNLLLAIVHLGSIEGAVWNMDGSTKNVNDLPISLLSESGQVLQETTTNEAGQYRFEKLMPVSYCVEAQLPESYRFARQVDTTLKASVILSDQMGMDQASRRSEVIKVNMGEIKTNQDIGMGAMGRLGDYAWLDLDQDGMQDRDEPGIPELIVKLYQYGQLSAQTTTDAYGRYHFDQLFPGSYTLEVEMPNEIKPTIRQTQFPLVASILDQAEGSIALAQNVVVPSGGRNLNADLGFVLKREGTYPPALLNLPTKDWTRINEQNPQR
ncbi:MAG: hypothetical protein GXZ04_04905 [Clostridiales bacterium]|nr:hypothetical protein [Clostridiales bacterium]